jgi:hypothetical protein
MKRNFLSHPRSLLAGVVFLSILAGCASRQVSITETGFLSSYAGMKEEQSGMYVYENPAVRVAGRYTKILIAPLRFELASVDKTHKIKQADQDELSGYFYEQLKNELSGGYEIVDGPGENVLILRSAITNIVPNIGVLNLNLMSLFIGGGKGGASLETELIDSLTGERMLAFVDARKGRKFKKGVAKWGHTEEALEFWANAMAEHLNRLQE